KRNDLQKRFIPFCDLGDDMSATSIASMGLQTLKKYEFDIPLIRGQGDDSTSNMINRIRGVQVMEVLNGLLLPLSKTRQSQSSDLSQGNELVKGVVEVLRQERLKADKVFHIIFEKSVVISSDLNITVQVPRLARRQKHRDNYLAVNAEDYFKV